MNLTTEGLLLMTLLRFGNYNLRSNKQLQSIDILISYLDSTRYVFRLLLHFDSTRVSRPGFPSVEPAISRTYRLQSGRAVSGRAGLLKVNSPLLDTISWRAEWSRGWLKIPDSLHSSLIKTLLKTRALSAEFNYFTVNGVARLYLSPGKAILCYLTLSRAITWQQFRGNKFNFRWIYKLFQFVRKWEKYKITKKRENIG